MTTHLICIIAKVGFSGMKLGKYVDSTEKKPGEALVHHSFSSIKSLILKPLPFSEKGKRNLIFPLREWERFFFPIFCIKELFVVCIFIQDGLKKKRIGKNGSFLFCFSNDFIISHGRVELKVTGLNDKTSEVK